MCNLSRLIKIGLLSIASVVVIWVWNLDLSKPPLADVLRDCIENTQEFESGDLIFRSTQTIEGDTVRWLGGGDYSHVGIINVEDGEVFVIHVVPSFPSVVRKDTLQKFVSDIVDFAVYRVQTSRERRRRAAFLAKSWVGKKPFDRDFSLQDSTKLYCTELVYYAYQNVGLDLVDGKYDIALLPIVGKKEVIYPKTIIDAGHVKLICKSSAEEYDERKRYTNKIFRGLAMKRKSVLILMLVFLVVGLAGCSSGPDKAVKSFFIALDAGQVDKAMGYLSTSTLNTLGHDKWQAALISASKDMQSKGGLSSVKIIDKKVRGDIAAVTVELTFGDGSSKTDTINLIKENGDWKLEIGTSK